MFWSVDLPQLNTITIYMYMFRCYMCSYLETSKLYIAMSLYSFKIQYLQQPQRLRRTENMECTVHMYMYMYMYMEVHVENNYGEHVHMYTMYMYMYAMYSTCTCNSSSFMLKKRDSVTVLFTTMKLKLHIPVMLMHIPCLWA